MPLNTTDAFSKWVSAFGPANEAVLYELVDLSEQEWTAIISANSSVFSEDAARRLINHAHGLLSRAPAKATAVARLATRMTEHIEVSFQTADDVLILQGDAWKEYAAALLELAHYEEALEAIEKAALYFSLIDRPLVNSAVLGLIEGRIRHGLGQSDHALRIIERNANLLLGFYKEKRKYAEARTIYAAVLVDLQRYGEAMDVFEGSAALAKSIGDTETMAYIMNNVGLCAVQIGDTERAERCFDTAMKQFEKLGMRAETPRVRMGKAIALIQRGRYNKAISLFYESRSDFLNLRMPIIAAEVNLRVVETLFLANRTRDIPHLCAEMIDTFTRARLPKNAQKALAYLHELSRRNALQNAHIEHVRAFLRRVDVEPELEFAPLAN